MWDEELEITKNFLDSILSELGDIRYDDLDDIMETIQQKYGDFLEDNSVFKGDVFNCMNRDEFADYLRDKGYYVYEDVHITYTIGGKKDGAN